MWSISRVVAASAAIALAASGLFVVTPAAPAVAAPGTFVWEPPEDAPQFTEYWGTHVTYTADPADIRFGYRCLYGGCFAKIHLEGPVSFDFTAAFRTDYSVSTSARFWVTPIWQANLPGVLVPGDYALTATIEAPFVSETSTSAPQPITIEPAALGLTLTTQADPATPDALMASVVMTSDIESGYVGLTPGGSWTLRATDTAGEEVLSRELTVETDGYRYWANTYWADPPPGEKLTLTVAASGVAPEYTVSDGTTTLSTAAAPTPPATPEPTPAPDEVAAAESAALPLWSLILAGLVFLAALLTIVIRLVRRRARRTPTPELGDVATEVDTASDGSTDPALEGSLR